MQGKWGDREKSLYMFLSLAQSVANQNQSCSILTKQLQNAYTQISARNIPLSWDFVKSIEWAIQNNLPSLSEKNEEKVLSDTQCSNFLAKASREINLMYLEEADKKYTQDFPEEISAKTPERLFEAWYIDFIPTDYQQYQEEDHGIVYRYSKDTGGFDYEMSYSD